VTSRDVAAPNNESGDRGFAAVLRVSGAGRLMAGSFLGRVPQGMTTLAVLLVVHQHYRSFAIAGVAIGAAWSRLEVL
jgi:hypothetical protein